MNVKLIAALDVIDSTRERRKSSIKPDIAITKTFRPDIITKTDVDINVTTNKPNVAKIDIAEHSITEKTDIDVAKHDTISRTDVTAKSNIGGRTIRAIKLKQDIYYGPKNANKNKFVRIYKKLKLVWRTESIGGIMVDGWFNNDKSQYIIKLLEDGDFKRFKFYGCDEIYDYFVNLGGFAFDHNKEDSLSSNYNNNNINSTLRVKDNPIGVANHNNNVIGTVGDTVGKLGNVNGENNTNRTKDNDEEYRFIGADLWSGYRTRQLLKKMPDNWGVIWK